MSSVAWWQQRLEAHGARARMLAHSMVIADALIEARDDLSPSELDELLRWTMSLAAEVRCGAPRRDVDSELVRLRRALSVASSALSAVEMYQHSPRRGQA